MEAGKGIEKNQSKPKLEGRGIRSEFYRLVFPDGYIYKVPNYTDLQ